MYIKIPSKISVDSFLNNIGNMTATHTHVMFVPVFTKMLHKLLQVWYLACQARKRCLHRRHRRYPIRNPPYLSPIYGNNFNFSLF